MNDVIGMCLTLMDGVEEMLVGWLLGSDATGPVTVVPRVAPDRGAAVVVVEVIVDIESTLSYAHINNDMITWRQGCTWGAEAEAPAVGNNNKKKSLCTLIIRT